MLTKDVLSWITQGVFHIYIYIPKDPGMSEERDYPYIPILRMGLEPSFLF